LGGHIWVGNILDAEDKAGTTEINLNLEGERAKVSQKRVSGTITVKKSSLINKNCRGNPLDALSLVNQGSVGKGLMVPKKKRPLRKMIELSVRKLSRP